MGVCCSTEDTKKPSKKNEFQGQKKSEIKLNSDIPELDQSQQKEEDPKPKFEKEQRIITYLKQDSLSKIEEMVAKGELPLNDHIFGNSETILHKAIIHCQTTAILEFLLDKGAHVDTIEKYSQNTPLFLACLDLKDDMVEVILKYNPNLIHTNSDGQNINEFINYQLFEKKQNEGKKSTLSGDSKIKYESIIKMLESYQRKNKYTERVDESR